MPSRDALGPAACGAAGADGDDPWHVEDDHDEEVATDVASCAAPTHMPVPGSSGDAVSEAAHGGGAGATGAVQAGGTGPVLAAPVPTAPLAPLPGGAQEPLLPSTAAVGEPGQEQVSGEWLNWDARFVGAAVPRPRAPRFTGPWQAHVATVRALLAARVAGGRGAALTPADPARAPHSPAQHEEEADATALLQSWLAVALASSAAPASVLARPGQGRCTCRLGRGCRRPALGGSQFCADCDGASCGCHCGACAATVVVVSDSSDEVAETSVHVGLRPPWMTPPTAADSATGGASASGHAAPALLPAAPEPREVRGDDAAHQGNHPMQVDEAAWTCGACGGLSLGPRCLAPSCQRGPPNPALLDGTLLADLLAWAAAHGLQPLGPVHSGAAPAEANGQEPAAPGNGPTSGAPAPQEDEEEDADDSHLMQRSLGTSRPHSHGTWRAGQMTSCSAPHGCPSSPGERCATLDGELVTATTAADGAALPPAVASCQPPAQGSPGDGQEPSHPTVWERPVTPYCRCEGTALPCLRRAVPHNAPFCEWCGPAYCRCACSRCSVRDSLVIFDYSDWRPSSGGRARPPPIGFIRPREEDMFAVGLELDVHDTGAGTALPGQPAHPPEASYSWSGPNPFAPPPSAPGLVIAPGGPNPFAQLPSSPAPAAAPQDNADPFAALPMAAAHTVPAMLLPGLGWNPYAAPAGPNPFASVPDPLPHGWPNPLAPHPQPSGAGLVADEQSFNNDGGEAGDVDACAAVADPSDPSTGAIGVPDGVLDPFASAPASPADRMSVECQEQSSSNGTDDSADFNARARAGRVLMLRAARDRVRAQMEMETALAAQESCYRMNESDALAAAHAIDEMEALMDYEDAELAFLIQREESHAPECIPQPSDDNCRWH